LNWEASRGLQEMIQSSWTWEQNLRNELQKTRVGFD